MVLKLACSEHNHLHTTYTLVDATLWQKANVIVYSNVRSKFLLTVEMVFLESSDRFTLLGRPWKI